MKTAEEHYHAAAALLHRAHESEPQHAAYLVSVAQVHATLALVTLATEVRP